MQGPDCGNEIALNADATSDGRFVTISVSDSGPGVPPDIGERIFEPLFTTKSGGKGTGVGLALCNRIISTHGGTIFLRPPDGFGATFVIELPVAGAEESAPV